MNKYEVPKTVLMPLLHPLLLHAIMRIQPLDVNLYGPSHDSRTPQTHDSRSPQIQILNAAF